MRNLITFLWKNYFFFLFVILEVFALFLVVNNNYYQRRVFINSTSDFSGNILASFDDMSSYLSLKNANTILSEENARFYNMQPEAFLISDTASFYRNDSLYTRHYVYRTAKVISSSINRRNNYLKINKGFRHGISPDMAVVTPHGIVGQVIEVSENFSSVMSILNNNARISAKLKASNQVGSFFWDGNDYRTGLLVDIPSHVQISIGDTVVTSGYSFIFPESQPIGIVEDYSIETGDSFYKIKVRFTVDYNSLYHVYVIGNRLHDELIELDKIDLNE